MLKQSQVTVMSMSKWADFIAIDFTPSPFHFFPKTRCLCSCMSSCKQQMSMSAGTFLRLSFSGIKFFLASSKGVTFVGTLSATACTVLVQFFHLTIFAFFNKTNKIVPFISISIAKQLITCTMTFPQQPECTKVQAPEINGDSGDPMSILPSLFEH